MAWSAGQDQDQTLSRFLQPVGDRHQKRTTEFLQAPCWTDRRMNAASALSRATIAGSPAVRTALTVLAKGVFLYIAAGQPRGAQSCVLSKAYLIVAPSAEGLTRSPLRWAS